MTNKVLLILAFLSSGLGGYAQSQPGKIVFYRDSHSKGDDPSIFCDGQELAHITRGSYIEIKAPPGRHPCVAQSLQESPTYVLVSSRQTAYQMVEVQKSLDPQASLITSNEEEFRRQKSLKPIESGQMISLPPVVTPAVSPLPAGTFRPGTRGVSFARCVYCPSPVYSARGRHAKIQGTVVLSVVVGSDGEAGDIKILQRLGLGMDESAVNAVRAWRFEPARDQSGQPVPTQVPIEVTFRLL